MEFTVYGKDRGGVPTRIVVSKEQDGLLLMVYGEGYHDHKIALDVEQSAMLGRNVVRMVESFEWAIRQQRPEQARPQT